MFSLHDFYAPTLDVLLKKDLRRLFIAADAIGFRRNGELIAESSVSLIYDMRDKFIEMLGMGFHEDTRLQLEKRLLELRTLHREYMSCDSFFRRRVLNLQSRRELKGDFEYAS